MPIYVIIDVAVKNQEKFQEYVAGHLPPYCAGYSGRDLVTATAYCQA